MANALKIVPLIAKEALRQLDNELVFGKNVFRGYEEDFQKRPNGYKQGDTLTIRRPADFYVRDGAVMDVQDIVEGSTTIVLDKFKGVDFSITNLDMTLSMADLSERVIKPAAKQLANQIDVDLASLFYNVPNWVGTPASPIDSFADFVKAPERLTEMGVPVDNRKAILSPADYYGLMGSQTGLSFGGDSGIGNKAYRTGDVGVIDDIECFRTQNVASLTCGSRENGTVNETLISTTASYATYKDSSYYELTLASAGVSKTIAKGEVFTISNCFDVNPVTKARLAHLKQFTVVEAITTESDESVTVKIWPIPIGANTHGQQNCDMNGEDLTGNTVTWFGTAGTTYRQNLVFNRNAFALVIVPLVEPMAAVGVKTESYKGTSIRIVPGYDHTNNVESWRMDVLYGIKCVDPRLAVRASGTT
jgi:hypothetical protein